jgi:hypothetical protein
MGDNIRMNFGENRVRRRGLDAYYESGEGLVVGCCENGNKPSDFIKDGTFLE